MSELETIMEFIWILTGLAIFQLVVNIFLVSAYFSLHKSQVFNEYGIELERLIAKKR
jgi:hypothetical protein